MKNLIIIGARAYGREIYNLATQCTEYNKDWVFKGFLDEDKSALDATAYNLKILSSVEEYVIEKDDVFICALGSVSAKKKYAGIIADKGGEFINLIHPTAIIYEFVKLGKGIIICCFAFISTECVIDDFVTIQPFNTLGHDCRIGKWSHLNAYAIATGYVVLEEEVTLHTRVTIIPKLRIGKGAIVGAGSIVIKNVKPGITVFGNPAKELKF